MMNNLAFLFLGGSGDKVVIYTETNYFKTWPVTEGMRSRF